MPRDADGNFPVTRPLVTALAAGFLLFNQALLAGLRWLVPPNEPAWDPRLMLGSFIAGACAWALLAVAQVRSAGPRAPELMIMAATAALLICAWLAENSLLGIVAAGAWVLWTVRGLLRRKSGASQADPV